MLAYGDTVVVRTTIEPTPAAKILLHYELRNKRNGCLLYTSDAADERSSVDLGGRRIIKKKKKQETRGGAIKA